MSGKEKDVADWNVDDVLQWINDIGLGDYSEKFKRLDGSIILRIAEKDFDTIFEGDKLGMLIFSKKLSILKGEGTSIPTTDVEKGYCTIYFKGKSCNITPTGRDDMDEIIRDELQVSDFSVVKFHSHKRQEISNCAGLKAGEDYDLVEQTVKVSNTIFNLVF
eukprot:TRINITY_DN6230_c0_g1_i2.p1 TRINITY_DN6230_c0_g1~~TRINITY_DN6230_c0_g1_i2.p1  ORF type:complete len:162 (+),score=22.68 TRINITY_DN6230_c0_g1_i2:209-694(+)